MIAASYIGQLEIAGNLDQVTVPVIEAITQDEQTVGDLVRFIQESLQVNEIVDYTWFTEFLEGIGINNTYTPNRITTNSTEELFNISNAFTTAFLNLISENIDINDTAAEVLSKVVNVVEYVLAQDIPIPIQEILSQVLESIVSNDFISKGLGKIVAENIESSEVVSDIVNVVNALSEALEVNDTISSSMSLVAQVLEDVNIDDTHTINQILQLAIEEAIKIGGSLRLPAGEYYTWVVNTETHAPWAYENYPFNSLALADNRYFGMMPDGLYELTGDTDNATEIDAKFLTGMMDLGSEFKKGASRMYLAYTAGGEIGLKLTTVDGGQKYESWYKLTTRTANSPREARIKLGRGMKALYLQFELENIDGADFSFDNLKLLPIETKRRI